MSDDIGTTSNRTRQGIVPWSDARRFLDRHLATMREEINLIDEPFTRAIALRELMRVWRAATLVLVHIRLPKRRKGGKDTLDLAYTVNPAGKIPASRSRKRKGPVKSRRKGRSHHKGEYGVINPEGPGRPPKYKDEAERKAAARRRARKSYLQRTQGRKRYAPRATKEQIEKRKQFLERLKAARAQVRMEMRWERAGKAVGDFIRSKDDRSNHRPDYGYAPPVPRLRRTRAQVARWGRKKPATGEEKKRRQARHEESRKRRRIKAVIAFGLGFYREGKRIDSLHDARDRYWREFQHRVFEKVGGWRGRRLGAKGSKQRATKL